MIEPKMFAKIEFKDMIKKMLILPGDRVGIRFGTDEQPYEAIRMQPDIEDPALPEPFRSRYRSSSGVRLPCNDVMIADSVTCKDTYIYCTDPEDSMKMKINGAGEIFTFDTKCKDLFQGSFNWADEQKRLEDDTTEFANLYSDANGNPKEFTIPSVTFKDHFDNEYTTEEDFKFSYTIGWRFISNYPKCYQGTSLKIFKPDCSLECGSEQCLLKPLSSPNDKRMLQAPPPLGGPDVSEAEYRTPKTILPMSIPTTIVNLEENNVPERLLQLYLKNYVAPTTPAEPAGNVLM